MSAFDYYEVLGVEDPKISQEELKKAYNKARREAHPDAPKGNPMLFRMVEEAWKALGTPDARTLYDQSLKTPSPPPQPPKAPTPPPQTPAPQTAPSQQTAGTPTPPPQSQKSEGPVPRNRKKITPPSMRQPSNAGAHPVRGPSDETLVQEHVLEQQDDNQELQGYRFKPGAHQYLWHVLGGLAGGLIGVLVMMLVWDSALYPSIGALIGFGVSALGIAFTLGRKQEGAKAVLPFVFLIAGWIIALFPVLSEQTVTGDDSGTMNIPHLVAGIVFMLGTVTAMMYIPKYKETRAMNQIVPVSLMKKARVFGEPLHEHMQVAATMRAISESLMPVTQSLSGTYMLQVKHLSPEKGKDFPGFIALVRHNRLITVTQLTSQHVGEYTVDYRGEVIYVHQGGHHHIPNTNPQVIQGLAAFRKQFSKLETRSLVIVETPGAVSPVFGESTLLSDRRNMLSTVTQWLSEDEDEVVRRDVFASLARTISSSG